MNSVMDNADLVIVRIGENVTSLIDNLQSNTVKLLNYIKNYTDVPILFGGLFWPHDTKTEYMSTAVNSFGDI